MEARGIVRRFGSFTALAGVDFAVRPGEIHALLGENGAGKSTLMNVMSGLLRPSDGQLFLDGQAVALKSPAEASARGVGMVHQHFLLVPPLSVAENLLLSASRTTGRMLSYPLRAVLSEARVLSERLGWEIPFDAPAGSLPVGTQQRVEILKALRGETKLLIFDEPTAVLTPTETPELFAVLRRLAGEGKGIVFISHKLDEVLALADRITVLRRGKVVAHFAAGEADADALASAMVGADTEAAKMLARNEVSAHRFKDAPSAPRFGGTASDTPPNLGDGGQEWAGVIIASNLTVSGPGGKPLLDGVSFSVAPGEIFGIAGVDGNGQRELEECLVGLRRPSAGAVTLGGEPLLPNPAAFRRAGVAAVPADRQRRGLALPLSIAENIALGVYDDARFSRGPLLDWKALRERAGELIRRFDIRAEGPDAAAGSLSGGNQQKVVIARALADSPKVVVAVNPTRGLDVGAIAFVHDALRKARDAGAAIVLISTELDEVLALSGRIGVLFDGRLVGIASADAPREALGRLMGGAA